MKDLKLKQGVLQSIMKMCDDVELEPLKPKKAMSIEIEAEPEAEGDEQPASLSDKVAAMVAKNEPEQEEKGEALDPEMLQKLIEMYSKNK